MAPAHPVADTISCLARMLSPGEGQEFGLCHQQVKAERLNQALSAWKAETHVALNEPDQFARPHPGSLKPSSPQTPLAAPMQVEGGALQSGADSAGARPHPVTPRGQCQSCSHLAERGHGWASVHPLGRGPRYNRGQGCVSSDPQWRLPVCHLHRCL